MKSKPLAFLLALVAAFAMWLYVITVISPESTATYNNVSVSLEGESLLLERGLMLAGDTDLKVRLVLEGNRSDLVNINPSNLTAMASLASINEPGIHKLTYTVSTPGDVATVQDKEPYTITVEVVERLSKKVDVQVDYTGTLPEGYIIDKGNEVLEYAQITVDGPKEVVEKIDHASVEINCDGRTETIVESQRFVLRDKNGDPLDVGLVTTDVSEIYLEVKVSKIKVIPLVLTVNDGGGATEDNSSIRIDPATISISGSEAALEKITELNLGTIHLAEITDAQKLEFEIALPEGIKNESGLNIASVEISFPRLSKKEFTITNIQTSNVADGMVAEVLTKQLTITVRGPKTQVDRLTQEDISVVLDLTDVLNTDVVVPTITFGEKYPDVGVVGKYTVSVTVALPAANPTDPAAGSTEPSEG